MLSRFLAVLAVCLAVGGTASAETLRVYGPGGPLPAMREAAEVYGRTRGVDVQVTGGPTGSWIDRARTDADVVFSGSETMMTDFIVAMGDRIDPSSVRPLYLRPSVILVRRGNPERISGLQDLMRPGHRVLVVNGAGQNGLWEDMAGRTGDIRKVRALRANIVRFAANSAEARQAWIDDPSINAWIIWSIWGVANPSLAEIVEVEPEFRIYRDTGVAMTRQGTTKQAARDFIDFLSSEEGSAIFIRWGWSTATP
ncbi:ABC transporter substrate-binding protein [Roseomonas sp. KE2513]|uniref:substrate-binding domain-containing protein n=1 Tax=Roseomonas sp. KE2513 TaxID=2479202 RepID=UPI0018DEF2B3|nr:substrate-binding domain-containing protein [Roseomonas sp. KE2513]MBI0536996.1 ABC transporter substrate-binding protein [Roseomonas sp. KE2513]